nr:MAG TPA: hypothetical protein [Caudoviricetes sp.]
MCNAVSFRLSHLFPLYQISSHLCWFMCEGYVGLVYLHFETPLMLI